MSNTAIPSHFIEERIFLIRGQKVMLDRDLAELYEVETKYLNRQVKRNLTRFPGEFMFELTKNEKVELVTFCHRLATLKHSSTLPKAFTEHGVAMLSTVLNSERAIQVNITIIRTFIALKTALANNNALAEKLKQLEQRYDAQFRVVFEAIRKLMKEDDQPKRKIGFHAD